MLTVRRCRPFGNGVSPPLHRGADTPCVGFGTEAATSLTDVAHPDPNAALDVMSTTCRWILDGALADAAAGRSERSSRRRRA